MVVHLVIMVLIYITEDVINLAQPKDTLSMEFVILVTN